MAAMRVAVVVVLVAAVLVPQGVLTYSMSFGGCAKVQGTKNFKPEEFAGTWYVVETFSTSGKCLTLTFEQLGKTDFKVTEGREYVAAQVVGINHSFQTKGVYHSQAPEHPAKFHARWSNNILGGAEATVVDTDYWQYAVLVECQPVMYFMKRTSAAILSRKRNLDLRVLKELKRDLVDNYHFDLGDFDVVDHNRCKSTPKEIQKEEDTKDDEKKTTRKFHMPESDVAAPPTPPPTLFPPSTPKPTPKAPKPARASPPRTTHIQAWCLDLGLC